MKRRLLTIVLFLLLGAVANVAVAWGCGAGSDWAVAYTSASMNESEWVGTVLRWPFWETQGGSQAISRLTPPRLGILQQRPSGPGHVGLGSWKLWQATAVMSLGLLESSASHGFGGARTQNQ